MGDGGPTFSLISRALLQSGSASLYLPLLPYSTARLFKVAATWGGEREGERERDRDWQEIESGFRWEHYV